jgi:terminase large subunit-like protein
VAGLLDPATLRPVQGLPELVTYKHVGWEPHPGQLEVINSQVRFRVAAAGRRFGKSVIGGHKLVHEALNTRLVASELKELGKRREFWIVGPNYSDSEKEFRVLWNTLQRLGFEPKFDKPGSYNNPEGGVMRLSLWGKMFIVSAMSAAHPESLVGEGLSGVIMAEAAKIKERVWTKFIRPTLADFNGWALFSSTPEGKNWFYDMWKRGQDPLQHDYASWRRPSWLNPFVYRTETHEPDIDRVRQMLSAGKDVTHDTVRAMGLRVDDEVLALLNDLTDESFNQEIAADFTEFVGRVFKGFDEEVHVGDLAYNPRWTTYAAVDYGFTNPSVWLLIQVDPHNELVNVVGEHYETGLTIPDFARAISASGLAPADTVCFYPDPASPGDTRQLSSLLRVRHRGGTGGEILPRVNAIRKALLMRNLHAPEGDPNRRPTLMIDRGCTNTIREMLDYRYPEKRGQQDLNTPENPMKKDDHAPEALGRFFAGHFGTPTQETRRARQRRADVAA